MIISHGVFTRYQPESGSVDQALLDAGVWFGRNEAGEDFYALRGTIVEGAALVWLAPDGRIFCGSLEPRQGPLVLGMPMYEVQGHAVTDEREFAGRVLNLDTGAIEVAPIVVVVPSSATKLGLKRALAETGPDAIFPEPEWPAVRALIASNPDVQEEWDLATEVRRSEPFAQLLITARSYSAAQVDALLIRAAALVA